MAPCINKNVLGLFLEVSWIRKQINLIGNETEEILDADAIAEFFMEYFFNIVFSKVLEKYDIWPKLAILPGNMTITPNIFHTNKD